ncbi:hydrocarbon binding protein (contains V4R domain) [Methanoplanus endosymbiosus]|uniref:Hydrocarbon binding protein (Contains V4R domain) n=1 Tax=Methanoplanus endosymbiosus TaxID=33865 RepID=A0A9E7PRA9_9EURY|nr:hydrocarbon binding protein (contains V4R domain) [Methanoplanus endosymbiosus]UUX93611.1 hydrocarbon binding protein (contains V4R domain) [Methanoplanus endosymbiosus]
MSASYIDELHEKFNTDIKYKAEDVPLECIPPAKEIEATLHGVMKLNGLVIRSLEEIAGRGANAVTFRAGKKFGHEVAKYFQKRDDIEDALHELSDLLQGQYTFEVWKPSDSDTFIIEENGEKFIYLVFHDCIVRQTLRRNGQEQAGPLCQTLCGYVVGAIEEITGSRVKLEIMHTGPNSCLKKLILK